MTMKGWIFSFILAVVAVIIFAVLLCHPAILGAVFLIIMVLGAAEIIHDQFFD